MNLVNVLGVNLKKYRKSKGLTQKDVATLCGLSTSYIGGIEQGRRNITIETLGTVSAGLGIAPAELIQQLPSNITENVTRTPNEVMERISEDLVPEISNSLHISRTLTTDVMDIKNLLKELSVAIGYISRADFETTENNKELYPIVSEGLEEVLVDVKALKYELAHTSEYMNTYKTKLRGANEGLTGYLVLVDFGEES